MPFIIIFIVFIYIATVSILEELTKHSDATIIARQRRYKHAPSYVKRRHRRGGW